VTAHICLAGYLNSLRDISLTTRLSLRLMAAAEKRFYRRYEGHVIAVSEKIASELREFYDFRGTVSVIHHGVNADAFDNSRREIERTNMRKRLGIKENETMALYVGDLTKSHTHLKAIAATLPEVQFVIVTRSSQYHWRSANVRILPATKNIAPYYAAADAFVFPTTYDAFGMVVLEAMAAGLPVFTSDRAGASEVIASGKDGFVTTLDNWVEATAAILRDRTMFESVGFSAQNTARRHDWASVVDKVEQVYFAVAASEWRYDKLAASRMESARQAGSLLYK
jgi:glycosyltransferase involved in cell wall biosynthesis